MVALAARAAPLDSTTLLPALLPSLRTSICPAEIERKVMAPVVLCVFEASSRTSSDTRPGVVRVAPAPIVITAAPASRSASMTPLAKVSLAIRVMFPPPSGWLRLMPALSRMLRPACSVRSPSGLLPSVEPMIALLTVMSLDACSTTSVPVLRMPVRTLGRMVTVWDCARL